MTRESLRRRRWIRRLAAAGLSVAMLLSIGALPAHAETGQDYAGQAGARLVGQTVPPLRLTTIDGATIDLAALRGRKAVYLKFWATWCSPCREQMPHFENVERTAGDDLEVIAINIGFDDTQAQIDAYRRELGLTMPIVRDDDGRLGEVFGLRVTPQHVIIGKDGRIQYVGHLADARLDAALATARRTSAPIATAMTAPAADVAAAKPVRPGDALPSMMAKTLDGDDIALKDPAGKRQTVLAFLSPWCERYFAKTRPQSSAQCRALREQLVALGNDRSVRWVGIASGLWASEQDLRDYGNEHHIPVPMTLDRDGTLFRRFGIRRVPAVVVVDGDGRIVRQIDMGERNGGNLRDVLSAQVVESGAALRSIGK